jgi:murein DD-endopeptidase MepM/ murein hydrolase activator NlpD
MNTAGKVILVTGALGGIVGTSYLIARSRRTSEDDNRAPGAKPAKPAPRPTPGTQQPVALPPLTPSPSGPRAPLPEPVHPSLSTPINRSHHKNGIVQEPAEELLRQARRIDPDIDLNELTGARLAVSEHGSGTFTELACIVDAELNRAKQRGLTLFESLTVNGKFGKQGVEKRPAAATRDPEMRHLLAARAVLSGTARGVSRGAVQFFDPSNIEEQLRRYTAWVAAGREGKGPTPTSCSALELLEAWSFDYARRKKGGNRCPPDRSRKGSYTLAWVGPIPGVNPLRLMLMERMKPGPEHTRRYEAARDLLLRGLGEANKPVQSPRNATAWIAAVYPLPLLPDGRTPRITSHHKERNPSRSAHDGVDWFYPTQPGDPAWKLGDGGGTTNKKWIVPPGTPAIAVADGIVQIAGNTSTGWRVWIDHGELRSGYFHLTELFVTKGQRVTTGQQLGLVGDNPKEHDARHLHFELSASNRYQPVDPVPFLAQAEALPLDRTQGPIRRIDGIQHARG